MTLKHFFKDVLYRFYQEPRYRVPRAEYEHALSETQQLRAVVGLPPLKSSITPMVKDAPKDPPNDGGSAQQVYQAGH
jgi:hypothetical protein